jgi:hypothetical protein
MYLHKWLGRCCLLNYYYWPVSISSSHSVFIPADWGAPQLPTPNASYDINPVPSCESEQKAKFSGFRGIQFVEIVIRCHFDAQAEFVAFYTRPDLILAAVRSFIHRWLYSPLLGPGLFFSFVIFFTQAVGLLGLVIRPSQGRYSHTGQHKHWINAHTNIHAFKWDSNPRSQHSSERRQFMP